MTDGPKKITLEDFIAAHPEMVAAHDAAAKASGAASTQPTLETAEDRQARITKQMEDIATARYVGILNACQDADKLRHAPRYMRSGKSALMVEYDLAKIAGRIH